MKVARSVAELLSEHVTLELEGIDRLYLNLYVPLLQTPGGVAHYWTHLRGYRFGSSTLMGRMTRAFVDSIERYAARHGIEVVSFRKGQRKDDVAKEYLAKFPGREGVLFIGKAQEKSRVVRTEKRRNPSTGQSYAWLVQSTINDTWDFEIGRRLKNLPALRKVGFQANRRLLDVQRISHDCYLGEDVFQRLHRPTIVAGQRAAALRFGDPRALAVLSALVLFRLLPRGFSNRDLREHVAPLLGLQAKQVTQGMMTYELRRLRLHGLIERVPKTHRYHVTPFGLRAALFLSRSYLRLLRPGLAALTTKKPACPTFIGQAIERFDAAIQRAWSHQSIAV